MLRRPSALAIVTLPLTAAACLSWEQSWEEPSAVVQGDADMALERADELVAQANSRSRLTRLIYAYEAVLDIEPRNRRALNAAAQYHILAGTGYSHTNRETERHFQAALKLSERSMYLDPEFRALVDGGTEVWDATRVLAAEDADAMGWWSTAVFYYFKEVVPDVLKVFSIKWIRRARQVMERIDAVAPKWNRGGNAFNWGIFYLAVPEAMGGDMKKSAASFSKARELSGPKRLLIPWGRAKYFHRKRGDRESFTRELRWVLVQNPRADTGDPYPWNVYFQREASRLLASTNQLF